MAAHQTAMADKVYAAIAKWHETRMRPLVDGQSAIRAELDRLKGENAALRRAVTQLQTKILVLGAKAND